MKTKALNLIGQLLLATLVELERLGERQMKTYREVRRTSCPSRSFDGLEVRRTVKGHLPLALLRPRSIPPGSHLALERRKRKRAAANSRHPRRPRTLSDNETVGLRVVSNCLL